MDGLASVVERAVDKRTKVTIYIMIILTWVIYIQRGTFTVELDKSLRRVL